MRNSHLPLEDQYWFSFIQMDDFRERSWTMYLRYTWMYISLVGSSALLVAEVFVGVCLAILHEWPRTVLRAGLTSPENIHALYNNNVNNSGDSEPNNETSTSTPLSAPPSSPVAGAVGQAAAYIIIGSVVLSLAVHIWDWVQARAIKKSDSIPEAYLHHGAFQLWSVHSYSHFCLLSKIDWGKSLRQRFVLLTFFSLQAIPMVLMSLPRVVIYLCMLVSISSAPGWCTGLFGQALPRFAQDYSSFDLGLLRATIFFVIIATTVLLWSLVRTLVCLSMWLFTLREHQQIQNTMYRDLHIRIETLLLSACWSSNTDRSAAAPPSRQESIRSKTSSSQPTTWGETALLKNHNNHHQHHHHSHNSYHPSLTQSPPQTPLPPATADKVFGAGGGAEASGPRAKSRLGIANGMFPSRKKSLGERTRTELVVKQPFGTTASSSQNTYDQRSQLPDDYDMRSSIALRILDTASATTDYLITEDLSMIMVQQPNSQGGNNNMSNNAYASNSNGNGQGGPSNRNTLQKSKSKQILPQVPILLSDTDLETTSQAPPRLDGGDGGTESGDERLKSAAAFMAQYMIPDHLMPMFNLNHRQSRSGFSTNNYPSPAMASSQLNADMRSIAGSDLRSYIHPYAPIPEDQQVPLFTLSSQRSAKRSSRLGGGGAAAATAAAARAAAAANKYTTTTASNTGAYRPSPDLISTALTDMSSFLQAYSEQEPIPPLPTQQQQQQQQYNSMGMYEATPPRPSPVVAAAADPISSRLVSTALTSELVSLIQAYYSHSERGASPSNTPPSSSGSNQNIVKKQPSSSLATAPPVTDSAATSGSQAVAKPSSPTATAAGASTVRPSQLNAFYDDMMKNFTMADHQITAEVPPVPTLPQKTNGGGSSSSTASPASSPPTGPRRKPSEQQHQNQQQRLQAQPQQQESDDSGKQRQASVEAKVAKVDSSIGLTPESPKFVQQKQKQRQRQREDEKEREKQVALHQQQQKEKQKQKQKQLQEQQQQLQQQQQQQQLQQLQQLQQQQLQHQQQLQLQQQQQMQMLQILQHQQQVSTPPLTGYPVMYGGPGSVVGLDTDPIEQWRTNVVPANMPHVVTTPSVASMHLSHHIFSPATLVVPDMQSPPVDSNFYHPPPSTQPQLSPTQDEHPHSPTELASPQLGFVYSTAGSSPSLADSLSSPMYQGQAAQHQPLQQQQYVVTVTSSPTIVPTDQQQKSSQPATSSSSITVSPIGNGAWSPNDGDNNASQVTIATINGHPSATSAQINLSAGSAYASAAVAAVAAQSQATATQRASTSLASENSSPPVRPTRTSHDESGSIGRARGVRGGSHQRSTSIQGEGSTTVAAAARPAPPIRQASQDRILRPDYRGHNRSLSNGVSSTASSSPKALKPTTGGGSASASTRHTGQLWPPPPPPHDTASTISPTLSATSSSTTNRNQSRPQHQQSDDGEAYHQEMHHLQDNASTMLQALDRMNSAQRLQLHHQQQQRQAAQYHHHHQPAQALPRQHVLRAPVIRPVGSNQDLQRMGVSVSAQVQQIDDPFGTPTVDRFEVHPFDTASVSTTTTSSSSGSGETTSERQRRYRSPQSLAGKVSAPAIPPRPPRGDVDLGFKVLLPEQDEERGSDGAASEASSGSGSSNQIKLPAPKPVAVAPLNVQNKSTAAVAGNGVGGGARQGLIGPQDILAVVSPASLALEVADSMPPPSSPINEKEEINSEAIMALLNTSTTNRRSSTEAIAAANAAASAASAAAVAAAAAASRLRIRAMQSATSSQASLASPPLTATPTTATRSGKHSTQMSTSSNHSMVNLATIAPVATSGMIVRSPSAQHTNKYYHSLQQPTVPYMSSSLNMKAEVVDDQSQGHEGGVEGGRYQRRLQDAVTTPAGAAAAASQRNKKHLMLSLEDRTRARTPTGNKRA